MDAPLHDYLKTKTNVWESPISKNVYFNLPKWTIFRVLAHCAMQEDQKACIFTVLQPKVYLLFHFGQTKCDGQPFRVKPRRNQINHHALRQPDNFKKLYFQYIS